ncbi:unnamed protein product [Caenorhabditis bovis]|uniref:DUF19 domain-containing protein n=1 Tax=Caenorhabditis bovis TaxID=2654633 RepID=A0A8S1FEH3_9PELO|nr:unnamed protein product [Caenorhabditis bovis]
MKIVLAVLFVLTFARDLKDADDKFRPTCNFKDKLKADFCSLTALKHYWYVIRDVITDSSDVTLDEIREQCQPPFNCYSEIGCMKESWVYGILDTCIEARYFTGPYNKCYYTNSKATCEQLEQRKTCMLPEIEKNCDEKVVDSFKETSLSIIAVALIANCRGDVDDFSVRVTGTLLCRSKPYANCRIDVYDDNILMSYDTYYSRFTNQNGSFDLVAFTKSNKIFVNPHVVITHDCWEHPDRPRDCKRKIVLPIAPSQVTQGSKVPDPYTSPRFGTIELKYKHQHETDVICGLAD